jgi:putative transposase
VSEEGVRGFLGSQGLGALRGWIDELPTRARRAVLVPTAGNRLPATPWVGVAVHELIGCGIQVERLDLEGARPLAAATKAWIVFEDESGQSLRPPKARTWAPRGQTPVVRVSGKGSGRVSVAGLVCLKPGQRGRFFYRLRIHRGRKGERRSLSEDDYAALIAAAHQNLHAPIILVWDKCAVRRFVVSPTHSGGIWRIIPGSPD